MSRHDDLCRRYRSGYAPTVGERGALVGREAAILDLRARDRPGGRMTLQAIADAYGVRRQTVHQTEQRALRRLHRRATTGRGM